MNKIGLIQSYTGSGKNKTTSAFGLAFRAIGKNWNVLIVQFMKGDSATKYGELIACQKFSNQVTIFQSHNTPKIIMEHNKTGTDIVLTQMSWNKMVTELKQGKEDINHNAPFNVYKPYDMLILDEILPALNLGLISNKKFFEFIDKVKEERPDLEIVLTGRIWSESLYDKIKNISDLMTDGRCVKHYFSKHCRSCKREYEFRSNFCPNCGRELVTISARDGIEF